LIVCASIVFKTIAKYNFNHHISYVTENLENLLELGSLVGGVFHPQTSEHNERNKKIIKTRRLSKNTIEKLKPQSVEFDSNFYPQSEEPVEQELLQENADKDIITQEITTFDDTHTRHETGEGMDFYEINNTMPPVDLNKFLERPVMFDTINWASSDVLGVSKGVWVFPDVFTSNNTIRAKLEKIAFWRPTFEITIRINGTPMHYGKLVFAWIPQAKALNPGYSTSYFSMFSNRWFQVSASSNQATTITIPYCHYREMISVGAQQIDLFSLYCFVASPLTSVNGAAPSVNISLYAKVCNTGVVGYNPNSNWTSQAGQGKRTRKVIGPSEDETKTADNKVVSTSVKSLAGTVSMFDWVPFIGEFAKPVSDGIGMIGNILSYFGLSTPVYLEPTQPMQIRQPRMLQIEDCPTTLTMGPKAAMPVSKDYAMVNDEMDSSSLLRFMQRPALVYVGQITSALPEGITLYEAPVSPTNYFCYDYVNPLGSLFVVSPLQWMSSYFGLWRGGIRIHLAFICSHFHSLRVRIWYYPYVPLLNVNTLPTVTSPSDEDMINVVLDITKETDFSFTIPYCQQSEWLNVSQGLTTPMQPNYSYNNGYWGIQLVNPLTSGATTVSAINYQVFVSAAADFQLAAPTQQNVPANGHFAPQAEEFSPQSEFNLLDCEIPSSSMQCLMQKDYPPLGNVARGRVNHATFVGDEITSVKQLCNMLSPYTSIGATAGSFVENIITPTGYIGYETNAAASFNWTFVMMTVYRYWRGGLRYAARTVDQTAVAQVYSYYVTNGQVAAFTQVGVASDINNITGGTYWGYQMSNAQFTKLDINPVDIVLPYYNYYKCYPTNMTVFRAELDNLPCQQVIVQVQGTSSAPIASFISGADDFLLGYQIGIPLQRTSFV